MICVLNLKINLKSNAIQLILQSFCFQEFPVTRINVAKKALQSHASKIRDERDLTVNAINQTVFSQPLSFKRTMSSTWCAASADTKTSKLAAIAKLARLLTVVYKHFTSYKHVVRASHVPAICCNKVFSFYSF